MMMCTESVLCQGATSKSSARPRRIRTTMLTTGPTRTRRSRSRREPGIAARASSCTVPGGRDPACLPCFALPFPDVFIPATVVAQ